MSLAGLNSTLWQNDPPVLLTLAARGQTDLVEQKLRQDLQSESRSISALRNLGVFLGLQGNWPEAALLLAEASTRNPADPGLAADYAHALDQSGRSKQAEKVLRRALRRSPHEPRLHLRLAKIFNRRGNSQAALRHCRKCGSYPEALRLEGAILGKAQMYHRALAVSKKLFRVVQPTRQDLVAMAFYEWHSGNAAKAVDIAQQLRQQAPVSPFFESMELTGRLHLPHQTAQSIRQATEDWAARHAPALPPPPIIRPKRKRNLRIGYLSQEFHASPAIHFILPLLEQRNRQRFQVAIYHCGPQNDNWTARARRQADAWRQMDAMEDLRRTIQQDKLDVLVDLSGHHGTHLPLLQHRLAPLQISIPTCPCSTGISELDYILTDRWVCPAGAEGQYTERAHCLPAGYFAYRPPGRWRVPPLPHDANGYLTFGFFQRPAKLNPQMWDLFAEILSQAKRSRLLIQHACAELDQPRSPACLHFRAELEARGIDPKRLRFCGPRPLAEYMQLIGSVDVALDSYPYSGHTTTCSCLWMGVPVVTLAGSLHVARLGWQILDRIACPELTAFSAQDYVRTAVELASSPARLRIYRSSLRQRMQRSPLMNGNVVRDVEDAYINLER